MKDSGCRVVAEIWRRHGRGNWSSRKLEGRLTDYKSEIRQYEEGILYIKREQPINVRSAAMGNQPREGMFEKFACLK